MKRDAAALLVLAGAACLLVFQVVLLGKLPDHFDFWLQEYVHLAFLRRALLAGELPLWNPQLVAGTPHLADPQSATLYPLTTPLLLALQAAVVARISIPLHHFLAGAGMYLLGRSLGLSRPAALAAGLAYALAPHFAPIELGTFLQQSAAFAPLILWALHRAVQQRRYSAFALAGALWAVQLLRGYPQTWYFTGLLAGAYGVFLATQGEDLTPNPSPTRRGEVAKQPVLPSSDAPESMSSAAGWWMPLRLAGGFLVFVMAALGLSAGQLLPAADLLGTSHREGGFSLAEASGPGRLTLLNLLGAAGPDAEVSGAFPGGTVLGLALAGVLYARGAHVRFFGVAAVVALVLCLGNAAPLWGWAYQLVPGFQLWHMPHRALFLWTLPVALLAGFGLDRLCSGAAVQRPRALWGAGLALLGGLWLAVATTSAMPVEARAGLIHLTLGVLGVCTLATALRLARPRLLAPAACALAGAVAIDLLAHDLPRLNGRFYPPDVVYAPPAAATWLMDRASVGGQPVRFASEQYGPAVGQRGDPKVQDNRRLAYLPPNTAALFPGLESAQGYLAIRLERSGAFFGAVNDLGTNARVLSIYDPRSRLVDLLGVRYFVTDEVDTFRSTVGGGVSLTSTSGPHELPVRNPLPVTAIEVRSSLGDSMDVPDGAPIGQISLLYASGATATLEVRAGEHTAEWMYDAPAVSGTVRHRKAPVVATSNAGGAPAHVYRATFELDRTAGADLMAIRVEVSRPGVRWNVERVSLETPFAARFRPAYREDGLRIWENLAALPVAWWVPAYVVVPDDRAALEALKDGVYDPRVAAVLTERLPELPPAGGTGSDAFPVGSMQGPPPGGALAALRRGVNGLRFDITTTGPGLVVINQTAAPGWAATVNGRRAALHTANGLQQAVYVPAGTHTAMLAYRPASVVTGLLVSAATAASLVVWAAWARYAACRRIRAAMRVAARAVPVPAG